MALELLCLLIAQDNFLVLMNCIKTRPKNWKRRNWVTVLSMGLSWDSESWLFLRASQLRGGPAAGGAGPAAHSA